MDSHLRVGTFEFARQFLSFAQQKELLDHAIQRHFPHINDVDCAALDFFKEVANKQLDLILHWMRIGFIHGVMNTDNMHIGGQTFDYGPCAFMNAYDPKTVFSSIDRNGRYAYGNQPEMALWNLSVLAGAILPQVDEDQERAVELVREVLNDFARNYKSEWRKMMCAKIGFDSDTQQAITLSERLLSWMSENKADFTNTYLLLSGDISSADSTMNDDLKHWILDWKTEVLKQKSWVDVLRTMRASNPLVIPRNEQVELALDAAVFQNDYSKIHEMIAVIGGQAPNRVADYQAFSATFDAGYQTFCGT
jgi:uncharacterized protein YdiU (UPF0061 family)